MSVRPVEAQSSWDGGSVEGGRAPADEEFSETSVGQAQALDRSDPGSGSTEKTRGWKATARTALVIVVVVGTAWAIRAEWPSVRMGFRVVGRLSVPWLLAVMLAQFVSMAAFALLQRQALVAVGGRLTLWWLFYTAHLASMLSLVVPFAGSGMAATYSYQRYREKGADPSTAAVALTLAGINSTVAFAAVMVLAAVLSGNATVAGASVLGAGIASVLLISTMQGLRSPRGRDRLVRSASSLLRICERHIHRSLKSAHEWVGATVERVGDLHLSASAVLLSFSWALLNWIADAACLVLAIKAVGAPIPWSSILLVWSAGTGARTFSPTPGGIGGGRVGNGRGLGRDRSPSQLCHRCSTDLSAGECQNDCDSCAVHPPSVSSDICQLAALM